MNINFGIIAEAPAGTPKHRKKEVIVERALKDIREWKGSSTALGAIIELIWGSTMELPERKIYYGLRIHGKDQGDPREGIPFSLDTGRDIEFP